jgi:hypothetical protein
VNYIFDCIYFYKIVHFWELNHTIVRVQDAIVIYLVLLILLLIVSEVYRISTFIKAIININLCITSYKPMFSQQFCTVLRSNFNWHCTVNKYSSKFIAVILIGIALLTISFEVYRSDFNRHCTVNNILRSLFVQKDQLSYHMTSYLTQYSLFIFRNNYFTLLTILMKHQ